jgi:choline transport protein
MSLSGGHERAELIRADDSSDLKPWHAVVAYEVINFFAYLFNCVGKVLPKVAMVTLYTSLVSFLVILITVPAAAPTHASAEFVFANFVNATGWPSDGIAFLVGLINPNWVFACLDCATHLAEEVSRPERSIPTAILVTILIAFTTSWTYCIAMFFSVRDLDPLFETDTKVPILELFYQAVQNKAGAIVLETLILVTGIGCQIACHTWQSRLCWSFARDRGLPAHQFLSVVHPTLDVPLNAHSVSCFIVGLLGLLYLGSSTAFNSMVTACIVLLYASYVVPIVSLLYRGRDSIVHGPFWLGRLGLVCNCVVLAWTLFCLVIYSFPSVYPATTGSMFYVPEYCGSQGVLIADCLDMNYVSAVYGIIAAIIALDWLVRGRREFRGQAIRHGEIEALQ